MPAFGTDFGTGRRNVSEDLYRKAKQFTERYEQQKGLGGVNYSVLPSFDAGSLTPTNLSADQYADLMQKLSPLQLESTAKQNLLNVGSGLMFGAASIPFMEFQKEAEFGRQQKAFETREKSPTAQMARNVAAQQMAAGAAEATAAKRNAFANLMRAAVEPLRSRK